ncbi:hypothetical protein ASPCAL11635 [Aspergillus calidoustus]|uniref:Protein kinase domain-containing protein n=1 Tax=Aspergillus calidoustus TaxID=454130 RepID=A0A0U5G9L3_ASPCI|nr:hypothetical protein ASPCAL11635 [Aspergillus calidoustus]
MSHLYRLQNAMNEIKEIVNRCRRWNFAGQSFVSQRMLVDQMTSDVIGRALRETKLELYHVRDITNIILNGGQRTFAILVLIGEVASILEFIKTDNFQAAELDSQLPWERDALRELLGRESYIPSQFCNQQPEFTAPVFSGNSIQRVLRTPIIFPFLTCGSPREGGFGAVYKVTIPREHQTFAASYQIIGNNPLPTTHVYTLARKEIARSSASRKEDYALELRNLCILKMVHHTHIVQLLGSYTHDNKDNFLFPWVEKSLESMLSEECPSDLRSEYTMTYALCGLSSALSLVHNFRDGDFEAIGCHHDLKPSNILVDETKFLLSDFGLSRFKEASEGSATRFRTTRGDYVAPECQDLDYPYTNHDIHRSADIWALGCIMLELLVYLEDGHEGRRLFRERRKFSINQDTYFRFHSSTKRVEVVEKKIHEFQLRGPGPKQRLAQLVASMLNVTSPEERPKIADVDVRLRSILLKELADSIRNAYSVIHARSSNIALLLEKRHFESWVWATLDHEAQQKQDEASFLQNLPYNDFQSVLELLEQVRNVLQDINSQSLPLRHTLSALRHFNGRLLGYLPPDLKQAATLRSQWTILQMYNSANLINSEGTSASQLNADDIGELAAIRRMHLLVDRLTKEDFDDVGNLRISPGRLKDFSDVGAGLRQGCLEDPETGSSELVLAEWRHYFDKYPEHSELLVHELVARTKGITKLLKRAGQYTAFCILPCLGFYHNTDDHSVGLIYRLDDPKRQTEKNLTVRTLRDILLSELKPPVLERKFQLALGLASTVLAFHKVGWLQKSISTFNIIFRCPDGATADEILCSPYLVGFLSSRQANDSAFSEGPIAQIQRAAILYEHPDYSKKKDARFKQRFDYYSLGIVLLELGLWRIVPEDRKKLVEFSRYVLDRPLTALGQSMGSKYKEAVRACLVGLQEDECYGSRTDEETSAEMCIRFKVEVIDRIAQCNV